MSATEGHILRESRVQFSDREPMFNEKENRALTAASAYSERKKIVLREL